MQNEKQSSGLLSSEKTIIWASKTSFNKHALNKPHVLIKGLLHNHLKPFGKWESSIVWAYYFPKPCRLLTTIDGNTAWSMGIFTAIIWVTWNRLHVGLMTNDFLTNKKRFPWKMTAHPTLRSPFGDETTLLAQLKSPSVKETKISLVYIEVVKL